VAIAASVVAIMEGLAQFDVKQVLIQRPELDEGHFHSAWTLSVLRGVVFAVIMVASAGLLADFFGDSRLQTVLYVLALSPVITGFANPKFHVFERALSFSPGSFLIIAQKLVSLGVALSIAIIYQSYWALVVATVSMAVAYFILSYMFVPFRPRFSLVRFRDLFSFSAWLSLSGMLSTIAMRIDHFVIGRIQGVADSGVYFMVRNIAEIPTTEFLGPLNNVFFPTFSKISEDGQQLTRLARETIGIMASIGFAVCVGTALIAEEFVPLLLGQKWVGIVIYLQILLPALGLQSIFAIARPMVTATGRTKELFVNSAVFACFRIPIFAFALITWGLIGAIWALVITSVIFCILQMRLYTQVLGLQVLDVLKPIFRPFTATLFMVAGVVIVGHWAGGESEVWRLLIKIAVGAVIFTSVHTMIWAVMGKPVGIENRVWQLVQRRI